MSNTSQTTRSQSQPPRPLSARSSPTTAPTAGLDTDTDSHLIPLAPRRRSSLSIRPRPPTSDDERRCWICFVSESEDDSPTSEWKSPCKCSLVAHESCLLDWIADMQKTQREGGDGGKLACPQCRTRIRLKQSQSLVLALADAARAAAGKAAAFVAFGGVGSVLFVGCAVYGVNTIYTICGPEYAQEILLGRNNEFVWTWRLGVGLPLIPWVLILSRTKLLDSVLPVLPVVFFCHADPLHFTLPPSPQITLAVLPYVRSFYNHLWQRFIASHEQRWIRETTPKFALESAEAAAAAAPRNRRRRGQALDQEQQQEQLEENAAVEWDGEVVVDNHNIILQGSNVTSLVLGALLWPSIAKMAGNTLNKWPAAWGGDKIRKWLPSQLARNVVGGLMVVVLKDFISLYCKYKRAQQFRSRSVMNYNEALNAERAERLIRRARTRRRE